MESAFDKDPAVLYAALEALDASDELTYTSAQMQQWVLEYEAKVMMTDAVYDRIKHALTPITPELAARALEYKLARARERDEEREREYKKRVSTERRKRAAARAAERRAKIAKRRRWLERRHYMQMLPYDKNDEVDHRNPPLWAMTPKGWVGDCAEQKEKS